MLAQCLLSKAQVREVKLFYSYAHENAAYRASIDEVLAAFKWDVSVRAWYDGDIHPGAEWAQEIHRNLDMADIVLLFITQAFVDSHYCMHVELPRALSRHDRRETKVIPVILESTNPPWNVLPISHLQVLPPGGLPLSEWQNQDQAVRETVHALVNEITEPLLEAGDRTRWKLYLQGDYASFSINDEAAVIRELRDRSQDSTLRTRGATMGGSVVMDMDSSRQGFSKVRHWFESANGESCEVHALRVLRVIEWYGAGIQAAATIGMSPPSEPPDPTELQFPTDPGETSRILGLTINTRDPLKSLDFIIDSGNLVDNELPYSAGEEELAQDFLTCLATPEEEMWVNLSPNDQAKLLGETLQGTRVGRLLLEHDLMLKRLAASLLHPDHETGRRYWHRVFARAQEMTGHVNHSFDTHPRLWVVPEKAVVYERNHDRSEDSAKKDTPDLPAWIQQPLPAGHLQGFVVEKATKVLCEQDYFASRTDRATPESPIARICHDAFVEIVLPVVEQEVNTGRAFAAFRRLYSAVILASWAKDKLGGNPIIKKYIDSRNPQQLQVMITAVTPLDPGKAKIKGDESKMASPVGRASAESCTEDEHTSLFEEGIRLREAGELSKSKEVLGKLLEKRLGIHGEEHYLTHIAMSQLGRTLCAMGEFVHAEQLQRRVLQHRKRLLGEYHEYTVNSMRILAETLVAAQQMGEAQRLRADADAFDVMRTPECQSPDNRAFYERYLRIYRNGVFFIRRHEFDASLGQRVTRAYFSGAIDMRSLATILRTQHAHKSVERAIQEGAEQDQLSNKELNLL